LLVNNLWSVNSRRCWWRCMTLDITNFLHLSTARCSKMEHNISGGAWASVPRWTGTPLYPLQRANLNHWALRLGLALSNRTEVSRHP
jgi:hypothetical protein